MIFLDRNCALNTLTQSLTNSLTMSISFGSGCCIIGLELETEHVRWVHYENLDGGFRTIVPILRTYTNRDDVKKLIDLGFQNGLPLTSDQLPENVEKSKLVELALTRHEFYDDDATLYRYIFAKDNKWICRAPEFFDMDNLN